MVLDIYEALLDVSNEINIPQYLGENDNIVSKLLNLTTREEKEKVATASVDSVDCEVDAILVESESVTSETIKTYSVNAADDINSLFWHYSNDLYLCPEEYNIQKDAPKEKNDLIRKCSILTRTEKEDALLCAAVQTACKELHSYICSVNDSGTTMTCIIAKFNPSDESTKVYCVNVGDSRTIMVNLIEFEENYSLDRSTSGRVTKIIHPVDPNDLVSSVHSTDSTIGLDLTELSSVSQKFSDFSSHKGSPSREKSSSNLFRSPEILIPNTNSSPALTSSKSFVSSSPSMTSLALMFAQSQPTYPVLRNNYMVTAHLMSEDHKLSLNRERQRVLSNKSFAPIYSLPLDASSIFFPVSARELCLSHDPYGKYALRLQRNTLKPVSSLAPKKEPDTTESDGKIGNSNKAGLSLPNDDKLSAAEIYVRIIVDAMEKKFKDNENVSKRYLKSMASIKVKVRGYKQFHDQSFIIQRTSRDGSIVGPEALCGRHNISMMMTRSIGDIFGPRSCIETPDISSFTVPSGVHARFIVATDGYWDVVSLESTRCMALHKKFPDSNKLSRALAEKALRRRQRSNMRIDDITVAVVDINPSNMRLANSTNGGYGVEVVDLGYGDEYFGPKPSSDPSCFTLNSLFQGRNNSGEIKNSSTRSTGSDKSADSKNSLDSSKHGTEQVSKSLDLQVEENVARLTEKEKCRVS